MDQRDNETLPTTSLLMEASAPREVAALARHLAGVQRRCSDLIAQQAKEIARLSADNMRLRAQVVARDSALAWAKEDHTAFEASIPGLPQRATLARQVKELSRRLQDMMRETLRPPVSAPSLSAQQRATEVPGGIGGEGRAEESADIADLEASVAAADLVICQTGCLSHGAYWRVQDHCKRTGKTCMLVAQPATFRVVRIHQESNRIQAKTTLRLQAESVETSFGC